MENKPAVDLNWLCNWLEENSSGIYRPAKEAAHVIRGMSSELESLRAQLKAAQEQKEIWFRRVDLPGYPDGTYLIGSYEGAGDVGPFYARPIPVQQSPAVVVPDDWNAQCTCGHRWHAAMPTENCPSCNPSPRITEQDAMEIIEAFEGWDKSQFMQGTYDGWFKAEGRALLDKLNGKEE